MADPAQGIPNRLFKYLPPDRASFLKNRLLRASPPSALNDPFEMKPPFQTAIDKSLIRPQLDAVLTASWDDLIDQSYHEWPEELRKLVSRDSMKELLRTHPPDRSEVAREINGVVDGFLGAVNAELPRFRKIMTDKFEELGVICFSEPGDNPLMWSHYAGSHRGFAVGFDAHHPFFDRRRSADDEFYHLRKVAYNESRTAIASLADVSGVALFDTKSADWAYEREWRLLIPLSDLPITPDAPSGVHLVEFPVDSISAIILGIAATDEVRAGAVAFCSRSPAVQLLEARLDDASYGIRLSPSAPSEGVGA